MRALARLAIEALLALEAFDHGGRIGRADLGARLLSTDDPEEARALAESGRLGGLGERPDNRSVFKLDLIDKIPEGEEISCYQNGDFIDLCAGPHVNYTSKCKNIKLMAVSSSYYLGDDSKPQLQRVYGTAFATPEELAQHWFTLRQHIEFVRSRILEYRGR